MMGAHKRIWLVVFTVLVVTVTTVVTLLAATPIDLQPNAAPWWSVPIFTLAGGIGGALIAGSFLINNENHQRDEDKRKREEDKEEDRKKREEDKETAKQALERALCGDFMASAARFYGLTVEAQEGRRKVQEIDESVMYAQWAAIQLSIDSNVVPSAEKVYATAFDFFHTVRRRKDPSVIEGARQAYRDARTEFYDQARAHIGLAAVEWGPAAPTELPSPMNVED